MWNSWKSFVFESFAKLNISHFCAVDSDSTSVLLQKRETDSTFYPLYSFRSGRRSSRCWKGSNIYRLRLTLHLKNKRDCCWSKSIQHGPSCWEHEVLVEWGAGWQFKTPWWKLGIRQAEISCSLFQDSMFDCSNVSKKAGKGWVR